MAAVVGHSGIITSWGSGGSVTDRLINAGAKPVRATITESATSFDSTVFAASLVQASKLRGMRSWEVDLDAIRPTPITGHQASVSFSPGYVTNVTGFDITFTAGSFDATVMGSTDTGNRWMTYAPGIWEVSGSYSALVDDTTAVAETAGSSEPATLTLTVSTGLSFAVSAFTTSRTISVAPGNIETVTYNFVGSGNVTVTGSTLPFPSGSSIAIPTIASMVVTLASGRTLTGDAFAKSVRMSCPVGEQVTTAITAQGTGDLAPA